jgi:Spy/CpxP family protein refolding chaperone
MTPKTRKYLAAATLTLLALPAVAFAARRAALPAPGLLLQRMTQRLDLTPQQVEEIRGILKAHQAELESEVAAIKAAREKMFDTIHADSFDEAAIRSASAKVGSAESELAVTRGEIAHEIRGVLTPEQQAEAKKALADLKTFVEQILDLIHSRFVAGLG